MPASDSCGRKAANAKSPAWRAPTGRKSVDVQGADRFIVRDASHRLAQQLRRGQLADILAGLSLFIKRDCVGNDDLVEGGFADALNCRSG